MILENFDFLETNNMVYGGHAGSKLGVQINEENWMLKFPKSTRNFSRKIEMSYSTSPLSEYIGSHVYELIGIPVHETMLGIRDNRVVVACKDFTEDGLKYRLDDFNAISNIYVEGLDEKLSSLSSSSDNNIDLEEIVLVMENNPRFLGCPELKKRFWDMFVVDALIGNNDRNNGNWGVLVNTRTGEMDVAPVFDNGASFGNNVDEQRIENILNDPNRFYASVYQSKICAFSLKDKPINPLKYIESMANDDCNRALLRVVPNIDPVSIRDMIESIPRDCNGITVISDARKEFYCQCIEYRYEKSLYPCFLKARELEQQGYLETDSFVQQLDDDLEL